MERLEEYIQFQLAQWLRENNYTFFHVPNGGYRRKAEAGRLKAIGVRAGVHDLIILLPGAVTLFVELKTDKGALSPKQKKFHEEIAKLGFENQLIRAANPEGALAQLQAILQNYSA